MASQFEPGLGNALLSQLGSWFYAIDWAATGAMIGGLSTLVVAFLTFTLVRENKLLRKAGNSPRVVAHFEFHPDGNGGLNLALSNVGTGPAFDVSFSFEKDDRDFKNYSIVVNYAQERPPMTMVEQGGKVSFLFAVGYQLFKPNDPSISKRLKPFVVKVNWRAADTTPFSATYQLDVAAYSGLPGLMNKPPLLKIVDELASIKKQLASRSSICTPLLDATKLEQEMRNVVKGARKEGE
ncbi:hypothetical protein [Bordetella petrii]|uniref:hypothetical protein n=1 Tax=Bordetella petrii TaxID=94624 RepID=UPI00372E6A06